MSAKHTTSHHADWLNLVEVSGPFVSLPVLKRIFPQGLEPRDPARAKALRAAYEEWQDNTTGPGLQRAWIWHVLTNVLGYLDYQITSGQALPAGLEAPLPEMGETLRPDFALVGPKNSETAGQAKLLIVSYSSEQSLEKPVVGKHWKATPATRMMELLHGSGIPLGLVTNGEHWMLVYAPRGETTGYASWYAALWLDEPITLRAFHSLLGARRFFGVAADSILLAMLQESAHDQQDVTDQLGYQVREAVEVLVQSFDTIDKESNRRLLQDVSETALYDAALTVMMRLVFLFSAEERGLLHLGKPLYDNNYAISTLQEQLQAVADEHGEEILERRYDAWARLLSTFRAVHGGISHQDLLMPAYGGSLFDPDRYPFLEGRAAATQWHTTQAEPLAVNNRVVLHLLNSLQRLRTKEGGAAETRRVSFRALDVEQIGHVYEGLLDHTAVRATEPILGIKGTRSKEPEISLAILEELLAQGTEKLFDYIKDETGRTTPASIKRSFEESNLLDDHKLLTACGQDQNLLERLRPFAGLIREDSFERPLVVLTDSVYVTAGTNRRSTGTHYTPPSLTQPIVQRTLEPLVYEGPSEGWPREKWKLRLPKDLLALKVCDMAMGSGAFLVQACRYLSERLVEAWEVIENHVAKGDPGNLPQKLHITPEGEPATGALNERLIPEDSNERLAIARRIVADRCLYGVDKNPMAVEMAKLSLWLITIAKDRPFTFLNHALKCGDSLVGANEDMFLRWAHKYKNTAATLFDSELQNDLSTARTKRRELESFDVRDMRDAERKAQLLAEADSALERIKLGCDLLVGTRLLGLKPKAQENLQNTLLLEYMANIEMKSPKAQLALAAAKDERAFHWQFEFPEVFDMHAGGFSAFLSNPPFLGGKRISIEHGQVYERYLKLAFSAKGAADICCYFFRQSFDFLRVNGVQGLLATNSIAEGDSPEIGLKPIIQSGGTIYRARPSFEWPGKAGVFVAQIHIIKGVFNGIKFLEDRPVDHVSSQLIDELDGQLHKLKRKLCICTAGRQLYGQGFIIDDITAKRYLQTNPNNTEVIKPYFNSDILSSSSDLNSPTWAIDFGEMSVEEARTFDAPFRHLVEHVKPVRDKLTKQVHEDRFWLYWDKRIEFFEIAKAKKSILVCGLHTAHLSFVFLDPTWVLTHALQLFCTDSFADFGLLQSSIYDVWARKNSSTIGTVLRYSSSDSFDTFAIPQDHSAIRLTGEPYYKLRQESMFARNEGLTAIYNRFHNPQETSADIIGLRRLHMEMDNTVAASYGWQDLELRHDFYETAQGVRFTLSEAARREVLARLLALNHERWEEDQKAFATTETIRKKIKVGKKKKRNEEGEGQIGLL